MSVARPLMYRENLRLVDALESRGIRARDSTRCLPVQYLDRQSYGLVGEVEEVELDAVESAVRSGAVPVLTCLGESPSGQVSISMPISPPVNWSGRCGHTRLSSCHPPAAYWTARAGLFPQSTLTNDYQALMGTALGAFRYASEVAADQRDAATTAG